VIDIEDTPLGDAVLADVARTGIIPLSFWNRGQSQIWARKPLNSREQFNGISIAESASASGDIESRVFFTSLGAQPRRVSPAQALTILQDGTVQATVFEPYMAGNSGWDHTDFGFLVYATGFQPNVGVFASSPNYWSKQSEENKLVWKQAVDEVSKLTADAIRALDLRSRQKATVSVTPPGRDELIRTLSLGTADTVPNLQRDLELVDEAKALLKAKNTKGRDPVSPASIGIPEGDSFKKKLMIVPKAKRIDP
jgi:TRAP-type C4-dicarboxylate transport system substrate-binding protein